MTTINETITATTKTLLAENKLSYQKLYRAKRKEESDMNIQGRSIKFYSVTGKGFKRAIRTINKTMEEAGYKLYVSRKVDKRTIKSLHVVSL